jgi:diguanylate cyclase (GGDEF)-like protein/PAS domain S-box-containing protein
VTEERFARNIDCGADDGILCLKHGPFSEGKPAEIMLRSISDAVISTDRHGRVSYLNPSAERLTGWSISDAIGHAATEVMKVADEFTRAPLVHPLMVAIEEDREAKLAPHALLIRRDGTAVPIEDSAAPMRSELGSVVGAVAVFRDITASREFDAKLQHLAEHDSLTDLPNRVLFNDRLSQAILAAKRYGKRLAILFLDLDRFKNINDTHGHSIGDRLLQSVAKRLSGCLRYSDTVSRQGGDEFVILLSEFSNPGDARQTADKIATVLNEPHEIDSHVLYVTASIGIVTYPEDGADPETLLKNADLAMYMAKDSGRNSHQFFEPTMRATARRRQSLEDDLRRALKMQELSLHYQPIVNLLTGQLSGAEALLRWKHPSRGLVPTKELIAVAEDSGLIVPIGAWVVKEGCQRMQQWLRSGLHIGRLSVNFSPAQIGSSDLVMIVAQALNASGLEPKRLELELTETALARRSRSTADALKALKLMGVSLALDDFGTGFSSLSHLIRYPIDTLKIDKSFLQGLPGNPRNCSIVSAVLSMAKSLNMRVIAEGIDTASQLAFLRKQDCLEGQGFFFSEALPANQFADLLYMAPFATADLTTVVSTRHRRELTVQDLPAGDV